MIVENTIGPRRSPPPSRCQDSALAQAHHAKVAMFITENIDRRILVDELSRITNMSNRRFSSVFIRSFGTTFRRYILLQRISLAKEAIRAKTDCLSQIALALGFADQAHFSRSFRKITAMTPTEWRISEQCRSEGMDSAPVILGTWPSTRSGQIH